MTGPAAAAAAGAASTGAGAAARTIATAAIGLNPSVDKESFWESAAEAAEAFSEGFSSGFGSGSGPGLGYLENVVGLFGDVAQKGVQYGTIFVDGLLSVIGDNKINLGDLFEFGEQALAPFNAAIDGILERLPVVGGMAETVGSLFGGMYAPIRDVTVALANLGDEWLEIGRVITGQSLDMSKVEELKASVADIFSTGLIIRPQDIVDNIGSIATRLDGLSQGGVQDFAVTLSQANEILGEINIDVNRLTGAFNAFGIEGEQTISTFNRWSNIVREIGAGDSFNRILTQVQNIGPSMRELGYTADDTMRTFAQMNETGEAMARMVWGFSTATKKIENEVEAGGAFRSTEEGWKTLIQNARAYLALGTEEGRGMASSMLGDYFGARAANTALEAIEKRVLLLPEEARAAITEMQDELNQPIGLDVEESASLVEQFRAVQLQVEAGFQEISGVFAGGLTDYMGEFTAYLDENRGEVIGWATDLTQTALSGLSTFMSLSAAGLAAMGPIVQAIKEITVEAIQWINFAIQQVTVPLAWLEKIPFIKGLTGGAFTEINQAIREANAGLQKLDDFRMDNAAKSLSEFLNSFSKETLPGISEKVGEFGYARKRYVEMEDAFKTESAGKDGLRGVALDPTKSDLNDPDGRKLYLKGKSEEWEELRTKLAAQGVELEYEQDGLIKKLLASNTDIGDRLEKVLQKYLNKDFSDGPKAAGTAEVDVVPSLGDQASGDYGDLLFPPENAPAAWEKTSDGTFVVPASLRVDEEAESEDAESLMASMGVPSDLQGPDGIVIPVSWQMPAGGPGFALAGMPGFGGASVGVPYIPGGIAGLPAQTNTHGATQQQVGVVAGLAQLGGLQWTSGQSDHDNDGGFHPAGMAGDFSNVGGWTKSFADNSPEMLAFAQMMSQNFGQYLSELIYYDPAFSGNIKDGKLAPGTSVYDQGTLTGHTNHVHIAVADDKAAGFMAAVQQALASGTMGGAPSGLPATYGVSSRTDLGGGGGGGQDAALVAALRAQGFNESQITGLVALNAVETGDWAHPESIMGFTNQQVGPGIEAHVAGFREMWDRRQRNGSVSKAGSSDSGMDAAGRVVDPTKFASWLLKLEGYSATKDWAGNTYAPGQFLAPEAYAAKVIGAYGAPGGGPPVVSRDVSLADYSTSLLNPYLSGSSLLDSQGGSSLFGGGAGGASSLFTPGAAGASPFGRIIDDAVRGGLQIPAAPSGGDNGLVGLSLDSAGLNRVAAAQQEIKSDRKRSQDKKKDDAADAASKAFWDRPLGERVKDVGGLVSEASRMLDTLTSIETYLKAAGVDTESDGFSDKVRGFEAFPGAKTDARPDGEGYIPVLTEMNSLINQGLNKLAPRFGLDTSGTFRYEDLIESPIGDVVDQTKQSYGLVTGEDSTAGERAVGLFGLSAPVAAVAAPGVGAAVGRGAAAAGRAGINAVQNIPSSILNNAGPFVDAMTAMPDGTLFGQGLAMASAIPFGRSAVDKAVAEAAERAAAESAARVSARIIGEQKLRAGLYEITAGDRKFTVEQQTTNTPGYGTEKNWWINAADDGPELGLDPQRTKADAIAAIRGAAAPRWAPSFDQIMSGQRGVGPGGGGDVLGTEAQQRVYDDLSRELQDHINSRSMGDDQVAYEARRKAILRARALVENDMREQALANSKASGADSAVIENLQLSYDAFIRKQQLYLSEPASRASSIFADEPAPVVAPTDVNPDAFNESDPLADVPMFGEVDTPEPVAEQLGLGLDGLDESVADRARAPKAPKAEPVESGQIGFGLGVQEATDGSDSMFDQVLTVPGEPNLPPRGPAIPSAAEAAERLAAKQAKENRDALRAAGRDPNAPRRKTAADRRREKERTESTAQKNAERDAERDALYDAQARERIEQIDKVVADLGMESGNNFDNDALARQFELAQEAQRGNSLKVLEELGQKADEAAARGDQFEVDNLEAVAERFMDAFNPSPAPETPAVPSIADIAQSFMERDNELNGPGGIAEQLAAKEAAERASFEANLTNAQRLEMVSKDLREQIPADKNSAEYQNALNQSNYAKRALVRGQSRLDGVLKELNRNISRTKADLAKAEPDSELAGRYQQEIDNLEAVKQKFQDAVMPAAPSPRDNPTVVIPAESAIPTPEVAASQTAAQSASATDGLTEAQRLQLVLKDLRGITKQFSGDKKSSEYQLARIKSNAASGALTRGGGGLEGTLEELNKQIAISEAWIAKNEAKYPGDSDGWNESHFRAIEQYEDLKRRFQDAVVPAAPSPADVNPTDVVPAVTDAADALPPPDAGRTAAQTVIEGILRQSDAMSTAELAVNANKLGLPDVNSYLEMLREAAENPVEADNFVALFSEMMNNPDLAASRDLELDALQAEQRDQMDAASSYVDEDYDPNQQMTADERLTAEGFTKGSLRQRATDYWDSLMREQQSWVEENAKMGAPKGRPLEVMGQTGMWWNPKAFDDYMKSKYAKRASGQSPDIFWEMPEEDFAKYAAEEVVNAMRDYGSTAAQRRGDAVRDTRLERDPFLQTEFGIAPINNRGGKRGREGAAKQAAREAAREAYRARKEAEAGAEVGVPKPEDIVPLSQPDMAPDIKAFNDFIAQTVDEDFASGFVREIQETFEDNGYYLSDYLQDPDFIQYVTDYISAMERDVQNKGMSAFPVDAKAGITWNSDIGMLVDANGIPVKTIPFGQEEFNPFEIDRKFGTPEFDIIEGAFGTRRMVPKGTAPNLAAGGGGGVPPGAPPPLAPGASPPDGGEPSDNLPIPQRLVPFEGAIPNVEDVVPPSMSDPSTSTGWFSDTLNAGSPDRGLVGPVLQGDFFEGLPPIDPDDPDWRPWEGRDFGSPLARRDPITGEFLGDVSSGLAPDEFSDYAKGRNASSGLNWNEQMWRDFDAWAAEEKAKRDSAQAAQDAGFIPPDPNIAEALNRRPEAERAFFEQQLRRAVSEMGMWKGGSYVSRSMLYRKLRVSAKLGDEIFDALKAAGTIRVEPGRKAGDIMFDQTSAGLKAEMDRLFGKPASPPPPPPPSAGSGMPQPDSAPGASPSDYFGLSPEEAAKLYYETAGAGWSSAAPNAQPGYRKGRPPGTVWDDVRKVWLDSDGNPVSKPPADGGIPKPEDAAAAAGGAGGGSKPPPPPPPPPPPGVPPGGSPENPNWRGYPGDVRRAQTGKEFSDEAWISLDAFEDYERENRGEPSWGDDPRGGGSFNVGDDGVRRDLGWSQMPDGSYIWRQPDGTWVDDAGNVFTDRAAADAAGARPEGTKVDEDGNLIVDSEVVDSYRNPRQSEIFLDWYYGNEKKFKVAGGLLAGLALGAGGGAIIANTPENAIPEAPIVPLPTSEDKKEESGVIDPSKMTREEQEKLLRELLGLPPGGPVNALVPPPKKTTPTQQGADQPAGDGGGPAGPGKVVWEGSRNNPVVPVPVPADPTSDDDPAAAPAAPAAPANPGAPAAPTPAAPAPAAAPPAAVPAPGAGVPAPDAAADALLPAESPASNLGAAAPAPAAPTAPTAPSLGLPATTELMHSIELLPADQGATPGAMAPPPGFNPPPSTTSNPYGTAKEPYNPYNNLPPGPLTPEEYAEWERKTRERVLQDQNRAERAAESADEIADLQKKYDDAKKVSLEASKALEDEYAKRAQAGEGPLQTWLDSKTAKGADSYLKLKAADDKAFEAAERLRESLEKKTEAAGDRAQTDALAAERPYPEPPGQKKNEKWKSDKDAEALGHGLVKGVLEEFGFDGSLFSNPLDWGITKFLMGGANYGLGLLQNMNPAGPGQGGPYPGAAGPSNIPGSIANGAAAEAGFGGLASLFQPPASQRPGAVMPAVTDVAPPEAGTTGVYEASSTTPGTGVTGVFLTGAKKPSPGGTDSNIGPEGGAQRGPYENKDGSFDWPRYEKNYPVDNDHPMYMEPGGVGNEDWQPWEPRPDLAGKGNNGYTTGGVGYTGGMPSFAYANRPAPAAPAAPSAITAAASPSQDPGAVPLIGTAGMGAGPSIVNNISTAYLGQDGVNKLTEATMGSAPVVSRMQEVMV